MAIQKISGVTIDLDSQASGDVAYFDGTDWVRLAKGEAGEVLTMNETATAPQWTSWVYGGTISGYSAGGYNGPVGGGGTYTDIIDKYSFATATANATDVGNLTVGRQAFGGSSSSVFGYAYGGHIGSALNVIDKFLFATDSNATDVGDLLTVRYNTSGHSSETHGYLSGGSDDSQTATDTIQKISFTTDGNATDVGNLLAGLYSPTGCSDAAYGYTCGGQIPAVNQVTIQRFSFVSDGNSTDVGDLTVGCKGGSGQSSETYGYRSGNEDHPISGGATDTIDRFQFAASSNATDVGDMTSAKGQTGGQSSTTYGYISGGVESIEVIERFSFATATANATDVGDLTLSRYSISGHQV